ncbi:MAG: RHS repeat-associated core domain-containing protein, partial [Rhodanobacteraceae bacterium]
PTGPFGVLDGHREFGDINGDGLEDLLRLWHADPSHPEVMTAQVFWNTGHGFYPDTHLRAIEVDVHPDWTQQIHTRYADPGVHMTDVNQDGRMDLVVFNNDHKGPGANNQVAPQIVFLLSVGDGTFTEVDRPVTRPGTRNDVKFWLDESLRPIHFYPGRLENDIHRMSLSVLAAPQNLPDETDPVDPNDPGEKGRNVLLGDIPFEDYEVPGSPEQTPGLASGWNLATLADVNADGWIDVVRHVGGNDPAGGIEVLEQTPQWGDELVSVTDEATAWPALSVGYSSEWSDRPEVNDSYQCTYPLHCPKSGLRVVREVTSRVGLTDVAFGVDPLQQGRTWQYSYRDPVANVQGLGFLGFSEFRVWDTEPRHPVETITTFDLRTPDASGSYYPGVGVPATVTVAQPILQPGQGKPATAPARVKRTSYTYEARALNNGLTHTVLPQSIHTSEWEQSVVLAWSGSGPDHLHVGNVAEPAQAPIHVDTEVAIDDYGNATQSVTQTAFGLHTEVATPRINDTVNWHLGLLSERTVSTLESQKNAVPVVHTTAYTYSSKAQIETVTVEPNHPDPSIPATMTFGYDDYGLVTSTSTTVANQTPRVRHLDYANAWPGAPEEHLSASSAWAEHDNPACSVDCRPAAWVLTHPAYGVAIATMDRNGVQTVYTYDGHGRPSSAATDGELPVGVTYAGRADAFGGMNGTMVTTMQGLQQVLQMYSARGAPLRGSHVGFDGQWINTFVDYDDLGRRVGISRPNNGAATAWTETAYDSLGRVVETTYPDGSSTTHTYSLFESEHVDAGGHYSYRLYDVDGRLVTSGAQVPPAPGCGVCLAQDIKTTFQYSATPIGAVATALDDQGHATKTQYDPRDRPVQQDEPSRGTTKATYNGFGETLQNLHVASGQTETHTYDDLGRIVTTTTDDGLTTYSWDIAAHGVGRLARAMSPDQIRADYRYDSFGRTIGLDQTDELQLTTSLDFGYHSQSGQLTSIDYPKAPGQAARFRAAYDYNGYGYLKTVSDATPNQPGLVLQQITARNADLALVDAVRGLGIGAAGGAIDDHRDYDPLMGRLWSISATHAGMNRLHVSYNYDAEGLVDQRTTTDEDVQIDETFEHDALHRLTHATRNGMPLHAGAPFSTSVDETYDSVGNRIDTLRNGQLIEHRSYQNGLQPYALTERSVSDPANPNAPQVLKYAYDTLGRMTQANQRSLTWTAFDLPRTVIENGQTWTFRYGAANERVKKSGPEGTTTYLAGLYEKHDDGHTREHVFHVLGGDDPVADVSYTEPPRPTQKGITRIRYPLTDALGSTNAVADATGTVSEHDYYDHWGLRSNADGMPLANLPLFKSALGAGFTGHEHDDALSLINMQGRLYDPTLGRFLSPDPIVANPSFS